MQYVFFNNLEEFSKVSRKRSEKKLYVVLLFLAESTMQHTDSSVKTYRTVR